METPKGKYVKRRQKDYSYAFKLQVVSEIERGKLSKKAAQRKYGVQRDVTIRNWVKEYGKLDINYKIERSKMKSPEQKILELEQQLKLLEKKNCTLEKELDQTNKKAIFFDMMIDIAEKELDISIRKSPCPIRTRVHQTRKSRN